MNRIMLKPNDWLGYDIVPGELTTPLRPAMWGNGQLELMAELVRPCVHQVICFGFGADGLCYAPSPGGSKGGSVGVEEHLVPAIYDADTGKKYFLSAGAPLSEEQATVTFRPDRQTWRYTFDDIVVEVSLILPRLQPGYLFRVQIETQEPGQSRRWIICHELRGFHGNWLQATEAEYQLAGSRAWCKSPQNGHGEAIGATVDAQVVNLGLDAQYANDIMVKSLVEGAGNGQTTQVYLARAFGNTTEEAKENLAKLLDSPEQLERESVDWWNQYLDEVPHLDTPDESFSKNFLWSWANFRMNRIDLPRSKVPSGLFYSNNVDLKTKPMICGGGDQGAGEAIQLLHDANPAHELLLFLLRETRKHGILSPGFWGDNELPGGKTQLLGTFAGLAHKYVLTTGDLKLLHEDIGGMTFLERLEGALEAQLPYKDEETGLFWTGDDTTACFGAGGLGGGEGMNSIRGQGAEVFFCNHSSAMYGTFLVFADIEELVGNDEKSLRYRRMAEDVHKAIQTHLWNEELGFFCDLGRDGSFTDYQGISGFWTGLVANQFYRPGGAATPEQAERLAAWCSHPDFVSDFGMVSLARSNPYYEPDSYKGFAGGFDMHWTNQVPAGLYAHGCYEEADRQMFKLFRRLGENAGLGPRYRGECYHADTGEILPWRFANYPCILSALTSVIEGVFGLRWTKDALTVYVNSPWPWVKLSNLKIRKSLLDLELTADGSLIASINGSEAARSDDGKFVLPWEMFG